MEGKARDPGLEGTHGAIWESLKSMDFMFKHFKATVDGMEAEMAAGRLSREEWHYYSTKIDAGYLKLKHYYQEFDNSYIYRLAIFLHPCYRLDYFEEQWTGHTRWINAAKDVIRAAYERYEHDYFTHRDGNDAQGNGYNDTALSGQDNDVWADFESFGRPTNSSRRARKRRRIETTQLDAYINQGASEYVVKSPLEWWQGEGSQWPVLQRMAFDIFSIPAMSAEPERIFSMAKLVVSSERTRMEDDMIEAEVCLKHWLVNKTVE